MEKQTVNKFGEIWKRAKKQTAERVAVIEQAITALQKGKLSKKLRSQAEQLAHKLAGSLGMFGSDEGSRLAREIELLFQAGIQQPQQVRQLKQLVVALQEEIQSLNTQNVPELMSNEKPTDTV